MGLPLTPKMLVVPVGDVMVEPPVFSVVASVEVVMAVGVTEL